jgi:hypothetical protein
VLSGVSDRATVEQFPYRPDFVYDSVADIDPAVLGGGAQRVSHGSTAQRSKTETHEWGD